MSTSSIEQLLSLENKVFRAYLFYSSLLVIKVMLMMPLTARLRMKKNIYISPEDAKFFRGKAGIQDGDIERVRRAHLNDLENILIYFVAAFGYLLTSPEPATAVLLFQVYTAARYIHTLVYAIFVLPQPSRALIFFVGFLITGYMAFRTAAHFFNY